jgi:hypothetical protein
MKKGWQTKTLGQVCEVFAVGDWVENKDQSSDGSRRLSNVFAGTKTNRHPRA